MRLAWMDGPHSPSLIDLTPWRMADGARGEAAPGARGEARRGDGDARGEAAASDVVLQTASGSSGGRGGRQRCQKQKQKRRAEAEARGTGGVHGIHGSTARDCTGRITRQARDRRLSDQAAAQSKLGREGLRGWQLAQAEAAWLSDSDVAGWQTRLAVSDCAVKDNDEVAAVVEDVVEDRGGDGAEVEVSGEDGDVDESGSSHAEVPRKKQRTGPKIRKLSAAEAGARGAFGRDAVAQQSSRSLAEEEASPAAAGSCQRRSLRRRRSTTSSEDAPLAALAAPSVEVRARSFGVGLSMGYMVTGVSGVGSTGTHNPWVVRSGAAVSVYAPLRKDRQKMCPAPCTVALCISCADATAPASEDPVPRGATLACQESG
jgi:hypothetical protein